jgi:hypothetical protein
MPTHLLALVPSLALILASGGLRTDRLSPEQLHVWNKIVEIVMAEDGGGQPLHPTLRQLWDAVDTSGHVIHIEIPERKGPRSYIAGRFVITKVDPDGEAHEGILILNLRAIDKASTGPGATRGGGFIPFKGLGKDERYAELLGHELAHAVWHLANTERARLAQRLQGELETEMERLLRVGVRGPDEGLQERVATLDRRAREVEEPAEAAEVAIWKELKAGRQVR